MRFLLILGAMLMSSAAQAKTDWKLVIHGGAGTIEKAHITPEREAAIRAALDKALAAGSDILGSGGSALDAVEASVRVLEDDPNFNAGRGSVFTYNGHVELDASIMDGRTRAAGAVTGVTRTKNPIGLARAGSALFWKTTGATASPARMGFIALSPAFTLLALGAALALLAAPVQRFAEAAAEQLAERRLHAAAVLHATDGPTTRPVPPEPRP